MKNLLSIEALTREDITSILSLAEVMKKNRGRHDKHPLRHQCWALIFSKSSTRTRVSFEVGIRELGGDVMFLAASDIQLGRGEPIKDTARVMGRMLHGAVIRTFAQADVDEFAEYSGIPTVNALTDEEHPCQILADLQTIWSVRGSLEGISVCFVGDGACNVARSWLWAAARMGFELRIAAPAAFQPDPAVVTAAFPTRVKPAGAGNQSPSEFTAPSGGRLILTEDPDVAADGVHVLYTDVWISMGKEEETAYRIAQLGRYQIDDALVARATAGAMVMHCLPAYRGKEIAENTFEAHAGTIFEQAENRLHVQKAILSILADR